MDEGDDDWVVDCAAASAAPATSKEVVKCMLKVSYGGSAVWEVEYGRWRLKNANNE